MATLYKHGPIVGVYKRRGDRYVCFENGTVMRNRNRTGWRMTAFVTSRLLASGLLEPDTSSAAMAIMTRQAADSHAHKMTLLQRRVSRAG